MQYSRKLYAYFLALIMGLGSVFSCPLAVGTEQTVVALTQKPPAAESSRHPSGASAVPEKQGTIAPVSEAFEAWAQAWLNDQSEEALAAAKDRTQNHLRQPLQAAPNAQTGKSSRQGQGSQAQTTTKDGAPSLYFPLEEIHNGLIPSPLELERPSYFAKVDPARRGGDPEMENLLPAMQTARPLRSTPLGGSLSEEEIRRLVQQTRFSLADQGHITPIKDQGQEGNCWAFATIATIEGNWHKAYGESLDLSERHLAVKNGFNLPVGGNMMMSNGYLGLRKGPVLEKSLPYSQDQGPYDGTYPRKIQIAHSDYSRTQPIAGLRQAFKRDHYYSTLGDFKSNPKAYEDFYKDYLDYIRPIQERNVLAIKRQLVTQGVVSTALYSKPAAVKDDIYAYTPFDSQFADKNDHAVAIVGWDDSISKENFKAYEEKYPGKCFLPSRMQLPHRDGAFICKNSWGPDKCDKGYFYISYDDLNVGSEENCSFTCVPNDPAKTTWYHGKYGTSGTAMPWRIPSVSEIYYGNYFSNPGASKGGKTELLDSVTLDFVTYDTDYKVFILTDLKDPSSISVAGKKPVVEGRVEYAGVKYTPLPKPGIQLAPGTNFAVIVYAQFDEPAANPLAVERTVKTKAYDENNRLQLIKFTEVTSEANQSFVSRDGKTFEDCKGLFADPIHLQVKAHSHPADEKPTPPTSPTKSSQPTGKATETTMTQTTTITTKATSTPTTTKSTPINPPAPKPEPTKSATPSSTKGNPDPKPEPNPVIYKPVPTPEFENKIDSIFGVNTSVLEGIINIQLPDSSVDLGLNEALDEAKKQALEVSAMNRLGKSPEKIQAKVDAAVESFEKTVKKQKVAEKGVVLKLVTNLPEKSLVMKNGSTATIPAVFYVFATNHDIVDSHIMNFDDRSVTVDGRPYALFSWKEPDNGNSGPVGSRLLMALKSFFGFGADPDETLFTLQGSWLPKPQTPRTAPAPIAAEKLQKQAQTYWQGGNEPVTPSADRAELEAAYHINLEVMSKKNKESILQSQEYTNVEELYKQILDGSSVASTTIRTTVDEFDEALQRMNFANEGVVLKLRTNLPEGLTVKEPSGNAVNLPAYQYIFFTNLALAQAQVVDFDCLERG